MMTINRRVRQSKSTEDEEGEELDDINRGKEEDGGRDNEERDKEDGEGTPIYWSEPTSGSAGNIGCHRNEESDEDVERYFEE